MLSAGLRFTKGSGQEQPECTVTLQQALFRLLDVLLTIRARTPQSEVSINMELFINPPAGGFMVITTPYREAWTQGTRIRLRAPNNITRGSQEYRFDHWEVTVVRANRQRETLALRQNPLEAILVSPQVTITAVYSP